MIAARMIFLARANPMAPAACAISKAGRRNGLWAIVMVDNAPFHTGCVDRNRRLDPAAGDTEHDRQRRAAHVGRLQMALHQRGCPAGRHEHARLRDGRRHPQAPTPGPLDVLSGRRPADGRGLRQIWPRHRRRRGAVWAHDFPSLQSGRYSVGISNPNNFAVQLPVAHRIQYSLRPLETFSYIWAGNGAIPDESHHELCHRVTNARTVADVKVGVRIDHRAYRTWCCTSISPEGTRILLHGESRLSLGTNYGVGVPEQFIVPINSNGSNTEQRILLNTSNRQGIVSINLQLLQQPTICHVYYEGRKIFALA